MPQLAIRSTQSCCFTFFTIGWLDMSYIKPSKKSYWSPIGDPEQDEVSSSKPYMSIVLSTTLNIKACIRNQLSRILQLPMRSTQSCGFRYCTREWSEMSYHKPLRQSSIELQKSLYKPNSVHSCRKCDTQTQPIRLAYQNYQSECTYSCCFRFCTRGWLDEPQKPYMSLIPSETAENMARVRAKSSRIPQMPIRSTLIWTLWPRMIRWAWSSELQHTLCESNSIDDCRNPDMHTQPFVAYEN